MEQEIKIVIGGLFGDEGKGATVQSLCKEAIAAGKKPIVIRYSGGPQAGHTVMNDNVTHICSTYGSGVLLGVPTLIMDSAYFDPICAKNEYDTLVEEIGEDKIPPLYVDYGVKLITPYDVLSGRNNKKVLSDGTCGKGIYPTFKRHEKCLCENGLKLISIWGPRYVLNNVKSYYNLMPNGQIQSNTELDLQFIKSINEKKFDIVTNRQLLNDYDVLIFEGSQGLLLDMDCGYYPHVTPSKVGLNGLKGFSNYAYNKQYLKNAEVYLVYRTYLTRHGNGYIPAGEHLLGDLNLENKTETNVKNEYQGEFKCGIFDFDRVLDGIKFHNLPNYKSQYDCKFTMVLTHTDCLKEDGQFPYRNNNINDYYETTDIKLLKQFLTHKINSNIISETPFFDNIKINDWFNSELK